MSFTSKLYPGEPIINDSSDLGLEATPFDQSRGLELGLRGPEGYGDSASPFPVELEIPEHEWEARIKEMEETGTRLSDLANFYSLPCKDQKQTNYCWINAPTHCVELTRLVQGNSMVILSPASAGAPLKNFRNVGGWGKEGLDAIRSKGLAPVSLWPANAISRQYWTEETKQIMLDYRVDEWFELKPRNKRQKISCLLRRIPVACGYNWWAHEVTAYDPVWIDGAAESRERNSWGMSYGTNGYFILQGQKMLPDDAVCAVTAKAA